MAHMIFMLGAGASAQGGCPIMSNFFDRALRLRQAEMLGPFEKDLECVELVRDEMLRRSVRSSFDTDNLEKVLNAIDTAIFLEGFGSLSVGQLEAARRSLLRLIGGVLERTQLFDANSRRHELVNANGSVDFSDGTGPLRRYGPAGYDDLARLIVSLRRVIRSFTCDVITFNYDIGLEIALRARRVAFTYGGEGCRSNCVTIYKLHGSINWVTEQPNVASEAVDNGIEKFLQASNIDAKAKSVPFSVSELVERDEPSLAGVYVPLIVPPSENKATNRVAFARLWKEAAGSMRRASLIGIAGYSLPDTDEFVRHFTRIANTTDVILRRALLCDTNNQAVTRVTQLFGLSVREKVIPCASHFGEFAPGVWNRLHQDGFAY